MARWNSCNLFHFAPDAKRLWQFDAKGGNYVLGRELRAAHTEHFATKYTGRSWTHLWSPKLNVAWLPPESVFLKVVELPASHFDELHTMVEFQLEKISPVPPAQVVWTMHLLPRREVPVTTAAVTAASTETAPVENLQSLVVVIVDRKVVEQYLGKLEAERFQPDRLEVPLLDQLDAIGTDGDGVWVIPVSAGEQSAALTVWQGGGQLRHLSFVQLPAAGDRAVELKKQLELITWSGEVEGWLAESPEWHLIAEGAVAAGWETLLRGAVDAPIRISPPVAPAELAARTARRAAAANPKSNLVPPEYLTKYRQQFQDRLWLRGLMTAGVIYAIILVIYFGCVAVLDYQTGLKQSQVAKMAPDYTNSMQLQAKYAVLKQRQELKFAALDCWNIVAEQLPEGLTLQRLSFAGGKTLTVSGNCTADQFSQVSDKDRFYDKVRKYQRNGQMIFNQDPNAGTQLTYRPQGGNYNWSFGVELVHAESEASTP